MLQRKPVFSFGVIFALLLFISACGGASGESVSSQSSALPESSISESAPGPASSEQEDTSGAASSQGVPESLLGEFSAMDLDGNQVDQTVFEGRKLTMVNVWGTFCGPCISEMPDLGKLNETYQDQGFQLLGIVADVLDQEGNPSETQIATAKEIVEKTGAGYPHLIPSAGMLPRLSEVVYIPTTFFLDENGDILGSVVGAKDLESWSAIVEGLLEGRPEAASQEGA